MLPNKYPTYIATIPSTGERVKFRPYTVGEEKKLQIALEANDDEISTTNIIDLVNVCTFEKIKAEDLNLSDLIYLMIQIKIRSEGIDKIKLNISDDECELEDCPIDIPGELDLSEMPLQFIKDDQWVVLTPDNTEPNVKQFVFFEEFGAAFRQPKASEMTVRKDLEKVMSKCLVSVFEGDQIFDNFTEEEATEWVKNLYPEAKDKVSDWFSNLPIMRKVCNFKCDTCNKEYKVPVEGLTNFFG